MPVGMLAPCRPPCLKRRGGRLRVGGLAGRATFLLPILVLAVLRPGLHRLHHVVLQRLDLLAWLAMPHAGRGDEEVGEGVPELENGRRYEAPEGRAAAPVDAEVCPRKVLGEGPPATEAERAQGHQGAEAAPDRCQEAHGGLAVHVPKNGGPLEVGRHLWELRDGAHDGKRDRLHHGVPAVLAHRGPLPVRSEAHRSGHRRAALVFTPNDNARVDAVALALEGHHCERLGPGLAEAAVGRLLAVYPVHAALQTDVDSDRPRAVAVVRRTLCPRSKHDRVLVGR
mmetsp:Transcript_113241/g.300867  ORF Transcript_113241/g.300867 Transcript_113241/m.300867 type:complete len:283 (-) Transcript_113241:348-1196(-)